MASSSLTRENEVASTPSKTPPFSQRKSRSSATLPEESCPLRTLLKEEGCIILDGGTGTELQDHVSWSDSCLWSALPMADEEGRKVVKDVQSIKYFQHFFFTTMPFLSLKGKSSLVNASVPLNVYNSLPHIFSFTDAKASFSSF